MKKPTYGWLIVMPKPLPLAITWMLHRYVLPRLQIQVRL